MQFTVALFSIVALLPFVTAQEPQVTFFTQTNFNGEQLTITPDGSCIPFAPPFDQHVESVAFLHADCTLFVNPDCTGNNLVLNSDTLDLGSFNDLARSYVCHVN